MLFRLVLVALSIGLVVLMTTQVIWPAIVHRPFFPIFRGENRSAKAARLRAEAIAQRQAVETEAEIIRIDVEAQRIRDAAFADLIKDLHPKPKEPPK